MILGYKFSQEHNLIYLEIRSHNIYKNVVSALEYWTLKWFFSQVNFRLKQDCPDTYGSSSCVGINFTIWEAAILSDFANNYT